MGNGTFHSNQYSIYPVVHKHNTLHTSHALCRTGHTRPAPPAYPSPKNRPPRRAAPMETPTPRVKPGFNGVGVGMGSSLNGSSRRAGYYMGPAGAVAVAGGGRAAAAAPVDGCSVALRVFVLAATLVSAVVMGVDRQTSTIRITITDALPPLEVPLTANWSYSSAFV